MEMIKANNLIFEYKQHNEHGEVASLHRALDNVDLSVEPGDFIAVLGHNGSGKSTLAKHINALLSPKSGTLFIKGFDARDEHNVWNIRQSAGMVFQNPDNQIIATIVEEDVAFGPENLGIEPSKIRQRVDKALAAVEMNAYATHSPYKLSGGQKQRIAIAGVLAMRPDCIVLDEPTAMLDPSGRKEVLETVRMLNDEGITIIMITHFMEEAVMADMVHVMEEGKVVMSGSPREVFSQVDKMKAYGLDVPEVTEIAYELSQAGLAMSTDVLTIEEMVDRICQLRYSAASKPSVASEISNITDAPDVTDVPDASDTPKISDELNTSIRLDTAVTADTAGKQNTPNIPNIQNISDKPDKPNTSNTPVASNTLDSSNTADTSESKEAIRMEAISYVYSGGTAFEKRALDGVNLTVRSGEFIGMIGHTGSGKSTLIQQINGLLSPTQGQVYIEGQAIFGGDVKLKDIRQKVGLVFQYPEHQLFEMTIYKDVAFGPINMGLSEDEVDARVRWALEIVGITEDMYEDSPFDLSGGQKRRVAIAGVLAMKPKVLILDEPTAGLDPRGRDEILTEISKLHKSLGITIILVSHSMEDIARYVNRVVVMDKGQIRHDGSVKEVFRHVASLEAMGLAVPQTAYLSAALKKAGIDLGEDIIRVREARDALIPFLEKR